MRMKDSWSKKLEVEDVEGGLCVDQEVEDSVSKVLEDLGPTLVIIVEKEVIMLETAENLQEVTQEMDPEEKDLENH
jgi:hypothetical protein